MKRISILFVCMGNICRSPLAEGIFADLVAKEGLGDRFRLDSAGTGAWHVGDAPDRRSIAAGQRHGIDIAGLKARQIGPSDFADFDLLLCMDGNNVSALRAKARNAENIHLFGDIALGTGEDIPDPYYGDTQDFELVYTRLLAGCEKLLAKLGDGASRNGNISSVR